MEPLFSPRMCAGERKGKNKRKKRKEKQERKRKKKTATLKPGIRPSHHHYRTIEPNQPSSHLSSSSSSHLHSSKNPTISMLNSNLAYQKESQQKKPPKYISYTNNQASKSIREARHKKERTYTSPDNDHVHTPNSRKFSAPQSFRLRRDNMSNEDKVPTSLSRHKYTDTLASFDQSILHEGDVSFCFFGGTYPRSSRSTIRNSR